MSPEVMNSSEMANILKELYGFWLNEADQAKYDLIKRYWKTVSYRLIKEWNVLRAKGFKQGVERLSLLISIKSNPLLRMLPKKEPFFGSYYPVPLVYGGK